MYENRKLGNHRAPDQIPARHNQLNFSEVWCGLIGLLQCCLLSSASKAERHEFAAPFVGTLNKYHALTLTHRLKSHPKYTPFATDIEVGVVMMPGRSVHRAGLAHQPIVSHESNRICLHSLARKFRRWGIEYEILHGAFSRQIHMSAQ